MTEEELEIIREFEKILGMPKPPPPPDEASEGYEEYRNEGQPMEADVPDEAEIWQAEHRQARKQDHTEQKVLHDEEAQIVHRDGEMLAHDKSKVYTEKPLIEEEPVEHVALTDAKLKVQQRPTHGQLINAVKWAEILGKPKAFR